MNAATQFTKVNPKNAKGFYYLGTYAQAAGQKAVARAAFATYLKLAPKGPDAVSARSSLAKLGAGT